MLALSVIAPSDARIQCGSSDTRTQRHRSRCGSQSASSFPAMFLLNGDVRSRCDLSRRCSGSAAVSSQRGSHSSLALSALPAFIVAMFALIVVTLGDDRTQRHRSRRCSHSAWSLRQCSHIVSLPGYVRLHSRRSQRFPCSASAFPAMLAFCVIVL